MLIKKIFYKLGVISPYFVSRLLSKTPFRYRHGKAYKDYEKIIIKAEEWSEKELESYIVAHFDKVFQHSKKFRLYRDKYEKSGVLDLEVKNLEDIKKIPITTQKEIRENISEFKGYFSDDTGGTSGNPLLLYLDKNAWAREWAHFHFIWKKVGYKYTDAKFIFRQQSLKDNFLKYNFEHNGFIVNTYKITNKNIDEFFKILTTKNVKYLHGYPSTINDFLKEIEGRISKEQKMILKQQIECCFYGSEMPLPHIVEYLKNEWGLDFIAWYGHTESCVLAAADKNELDYIPFHTYGYVEVEGNMLLGTSYHNFDMPLIRYNTDDLVKAKRSSNGILKSFEVTEGRIFDFIYDKNDLHIALVGLYDKIGSEIFKYIDYIQLFQEKKGFATIIISQNKVDNLDAPSLMNLENIDIDFDFIYLKRPIKTESGKVPLRVKKLPS